MAMSLLPIAGSVIGSIYGGPLGGAAGGFAGKKLSEGGPKPGITENPSPQLGEGMPGQNEAPGGPMERRLDMNANNPDEHILNANRALEDAPPEIRDHYSKVLGEALAISQKNRGTYG
jgi:hypothetical protein